MAAQTWKELWEKTKTAGSFIAGVAEVADFIQDTRLIKALHGSGAVEDAVKVKVNKRRTKREYGQAMAQLSQAERDTILDIHEALRTRNPQFLENFVLQASLTGANVSDTIALLQMLAKFAPDEAAQLIDDMDLEKPPVNQMEEMLSELRRLWTQVKAEVAAGKREWDDLMTQAARDINADADRIERARQNRTRVRTTGMFARFSQSRRRLSAFPWD